MKETNNSNVTVVGLELSSFVSIRRFADCITKAERKLDVLIHNAGYAGAIRKRKSVDGIELNMATNYYGPFLLTHLLIDLLRASEEGRIIVVSSKMYVLGSISLNNLNPVDFPFPAHLYSVSKFAAIMFTLELARRLDGSNVTANCLHPGVVNTNIFRETPLLLRWPLNLLKRIFFKTPVQGSYTSIYLATSDCVNRISGKYFRDCREYPLNNKVQNKDVASKLWLESVKIVNLLDSDPKI